MDCKDKATDTMGANATDLDKQKATTGMEKCVLKCVDGNLEYIPTLFKRIKETIAKQNK